MLYMISSVPISPASSYATLSFSHYTPASSVFLLFLEYTQLLSSSAILHMLFPLPGILFPQFFSCGWFLSHLSDLT